jgi:D-xylose transport system permease protein
MSDPGEATTTTTESHQEPGARSGGFALDIDRRGIKDAFTGYVGKLRGGDPGAVPSVLGIVVLAIIFSQVSGRFISSANIGNLPGQGAYIAFIALGLVFVLLLGEIDLAGGTTGGMCAGFAAQAIFSGGLKSGASGVLYWSVIGLMIVMIALGLYLKSITGPVVVAIGVVIALVGLDKHVIFALLFAIALGAAVGTLIGWLVGKIGIPSFIVTLAVFIAWQGMLLFVLRSNPKGINNYSFWYGLAHENMSPLWSWVFTIVVAGGYVVYTLGRSMRAQRKNLAADKISLVLARGGVVAAVAVVITILANGNRSTNRFVTIHGLPWALTVPVAAMIICTVGLNKTTWGRHLFATGGNAEAARRAGIDVVHIRVTAFTVESSLAALGGIFLASDTGGAQLDLGAGNILLFSVAAAVIGGTSLFGGRGKPRDALIGAIVIVMIPNGIGLKPNLGVQYQEVITGLVLLVAAAVDALSRRHSRLR